MGLGLSFLLWTFIHFSSVETMLKQQEQQKQRKPQPSVKSYWGKLLRNSGPIHVHGKSANSPPNSHE